MFKTIQECRLDLVSHTLLVTNGNQDNDACHPVADEYYAPADFMPCSAARVSFGNEDKTGQDVEKDRKLMKYLAEHQHMTPFEYQHATFLIECPLFIRSQIHRHRTFSYNEISRRYTDENLEFWIPDKFRGQSQSNRQASSEEVIESYTPDGANIAINIGTMYALSIEESLQTYQTLIEAGVAREIARAALSQALLTKFYMGGNLRNWSHLIELRRDSHAQYEVQVVANRIAESLRKLWPESCAALGI